MAAKNIAITVTYTAWDTANNVGKTGDAASHTLRGVRDGAEFTPAASPVEVDATNLPGTYKVALTAAENNGDVLCLGGKSSTSNVVIICVEWFNEDPAMSKAAYDWGAWTQCGVEAVVLTTGGTILEISDAIDLDGKAACEVSIEATYSNHAKATGGLEIAVLGECNSTYQVQLDIGAGPEMIFTQNDTRRDRFRVDPQEYGTFKVMHDWNNTTASSSVTITTRYRTATVAPV